MQLSTDALLARRRGCQRDARRADRFLRSFGSLLIDDGAPLAGGALTLALPHPLIARRTWLWRAESGEVIEALAFLGLAAAEPANPPGEAGRRWLAMARAASARA